MLNMRSRHIPIYSSLPSRVGMWVLVGGLLLTFSVHVSGKSYEETKKQFQKAFSSSNTDLQKKSMRDLGSFDRKEAYQLIKKQFSRLGSRLWNIEKIYMNADQKTLKDYQLSDQEKQVIEFNKAGRLKSLRQVFNAGAKQLRNPGKQEWLLSTVHRWGRKNPSYLSMYLLMRGKLLRPLGKMKNGRVPRLLLDVLRRAERMRIPFEKKKSKYNRKIYSHPVEKNLKQMHLRKPFLKRKKMTHRISVMDVIRRHVYKSLSGIPGESWISGLVEYGLNSSSIQVRAAAAYGLGFAGDSRSKDALVNHLKKDNRYRVQLEVLKAIGRRGIQSAESVVQSFLSQKRIPVQYAAAHVLGKIGTKDSISILIDRMDELQSGRLFHEIDYSLALMTGKAIDADAEAWKKWWKKNKDLSLDPPSKRTVPDDKKRGKPSKTSSTEFYGVSLTSNNVMFLVDASLSMREKAEYQGTGGGGFEGKMAGPKIPPLPEEPTRWDVAQRQLMKAIKGLEPNQMFNIVFFAGFESVWNENRMVPATPKNKREAFQYIQETKLEWATVIFDALEYGFNFGTVGNMPVGEQKRLTQRMARFSPDALVLLSDGAPYLGQYDLKRKTGSQYNNFYQKVNRMNQFRQLKLTGITIGGGNKKFFQKLVNRSIYYPNPKKRPDWWIQPGVAVSR